MRCVAAGTRRPIVLVFATVLVSGLFNLEGHGVDVVGYAPKGLTAVEPDFSLAPKLWTSAVSIAGQCNAL